MSQIMSRPSSDPRSWGKHYWFVMHSVCLFYPDHPSSEHMAHMRNFFLSLQGLLPCPSCAAHYAQLLRKHPIEAALNSKFEMIRWVNTLHNEVNRRIGHPIVPLSAYMQSIDARDPPPLMRTEPMLAGALGAVALVLLVWWWYTTRRPDAR